MQQAIKNYLSKHGFERFLPKAALFDMDGVLYDSMPNHAVAWHDSMEKFGIHMTAYDAYATEGARGIDTKAQEMYDLKTKFFHGMKEPDIMPGVRELMQKMHERGMLIGVVTGSGQRPLINRLLNDFHEFVDESRLVTAYDVRRGKPYPDPYLMGLEKAGHLQPWEGMVIENAPLGVRAGVAARIFTVAVNSGPLPDSALTDEGTDLIFSNMTDFLKVFSTL